MAVDTPLRRFSMMAFNQHQRVLHPPQGSVGADERGSFLRLYSGINSGAGVPDVERSRALWASTGIR